MLQKFLKTIDIIGIKFYMYLGENPVLSILFQLFSFLFNFRNLQLKGTFISKLLLLNNTKMNFHYFNYYYNLLF